MVFVFPSYDYGVLDCVQPLWRGRGEESEITGYIVRPRRLSYQVERLLLHQK